MKSVFTDPSATNPHTADYTSRPISINNCCKSCQMITAKITEERPTHANYGNIRVLQLIFALLIRKMNVVAECVDSAPRRALAEISRIYSSIFAFLKEGAVPSWQLQPGQLDFRKYGEN